MTEELTDEMIKRKHKEFDDDIEAYLNELRGNKTPPLKEKLRNALSRLTARKPMPNLMKQAK